MHETPVPVIQVRSLSKRFGKILATNNIHFDLRKGEVHAILGENGAGKSTLLNIISGLYRADSGDIYINGVKADIRSPVDTSRLGIHMVHQRFMLIPVLSVTENIILGVEPIKKISLDISKAKNKIQRLIDNYGIHIDLDAVVDHLPVGTQQLVEIIKGLYREAEILLLDEPTSMLTPSEVHQFFALLRRFKEKGVSIIFISHKIKEIMSIADRITIMRQGKIISTLSRENSDENSLSELMVGRKVSRSHVMPPVSGKKVVLEISNLHVSGDIDTEAVRNASFNVHKGEILGIAGVQGNGQTELAEALTGLRTIRKGSIRICGHILSTNNPRVLYNHGLGHIPENRDKHGLVLPFSIADNQVLCSFYKPPFAGKIQRNMRAVIDHSEHLMQRFTINAPGPKTPVSTLSGGNQQKVVLSRELSRDIRFLLANQPTRGLDIGSIEFIHSQLIDMRNAGGAIVIISSDLDEILALSDRIGIMYQGRITIISHAKKITRDELGLYMSGAKTANKNGHEIRSV